MMIDNNNNNNKSLKAKLKFWHRRNCSFIDDIIKKVEKHLAQAQTQSQATGDYDDTLVEKALISKMITLKKKKKLHDLRQRAKIHDTTSSDDNSSYFFAKVK